MIERYLSMVRYRISQWVPRHTKHRDKTAFESPNMKIWLSWGGYPVWFHVSLGPVDIMWMRWMRKR